MTNRVGTIESGTLKRSNPNDAGQDVYSDQSLLIYAGKSAMIKTNLRINVPLGHVGILKSRSGLSVKHSLEVGAGVVDSGYTGEVMVHLYNHGELHYQVNIGDKIAQLLTLPVNLEDYHQVENLIETSRGTSGFGSSGK